MKPTHQEVVDLCEKAVLAAELKLALCSDQAIALDMVDVVARTLKHRMQVHWPQLHREARMFAIAESAASVQRILKRVKEKP